MHMHHNYNKRIHNCIHKSHNMQHNSKQHKTNYNKSQYKINNMLNVCRNCKLNVRRCSKKLCNYDTEHQTVNSKAPWRNVHTHN